MKNDGDILVCLGNPPYDRQTIEEGDTTTQRKGGWVRFGDQVKGGAKQEEQGESAPSSRTSPTLRRRPAPGFTSRTSTTTMYISGAGRCGGCSSNSRRGGVVTFITASSYLAGPGFVGVREVMRRTFDELWIIDLGGDNLGTRKTPNVFNIQTPVAIAIGVRREAFARHTRARSATPRSKAATREDKLAAAGDHCRIRRVDMA